jgi:hypothetical protein
MLGLFYFTKPNPNLDKRDLAVVGYPEDILGRYMLAGGLEICGEFPDHS